MTASIKTSLNKLHGAIEKLERAVEARKSAPPVRKNAPENDLFSAAATSPQSSPNFNPVNVRMLATRLDTAIEQVEKILKEGRG